MRASASAIFPPAELYSTSLDKDLENEILNELGRFSPREILIGGETVNMKKLAPFIRDKLSACVEMREDAEFELETCRRTVLEQFKKETLVIWEWRGEQAVSALGPCSITLRIPSGRCP